MPTVQTNGIETYYEERGSGPPVVFIHGALADHTAAQRQLEAFSDDYTAIAYDLRGHGRTMNPHNSPYSIDQLADDLDAFLTGLDLERPVLCGVSMGGMIAQVYASRQPDRLGGLVLADTFTPKFVNSRDRLERSVLISMYAQLLRLVGYERALRVMTWLGRKLEGNEFTSLRADRFPAMETAAAVTALGAIQSFDEVDVDLASITVPTLVLYGEHEMSVVRRHVPTLAAGVPGARVQEVPDAGHASPWDNPEFFNDAVRRFLSETSQSASRASDSIE